MAELFHSDDEDYFLVQFCIMSTFASFVLILILVIIFSPPPPVVLEEWTAGGFRRKYGDFTSRSQEPNDAMEIRS